MMLRLILVIVSIWTFGPMDAQAQGWDPRPEAVQAADAKLAERVGNARAAAERFLEETPSLQAYFQEAYGYAVFPKVRKGALGLGGARGSGVLFKGGEPEKRAFLTQYTAGLQLGGKTFSQIIFFKNRDAYDRFDYGEFAFSAQANLVAVGGGREGTADYADDVAVFVGDSKGVMMDISLGGQNFGTRALN